MSDTWHKGSYAAFVMSLVLIKRGWLQVTG